MCLYISLLSYILSPVHFWFYLILKNNNRWHEIIIKYIISDFRHCYNLINTSHLLPMILVISFNPAGSYLVKEHSKIYGPKKSMYVLELALPALLPSWKIWVDPPPTPSMLRSGSISNGWLSLIIIGCYVFHLFSMTCQINKVLGWPVNYIS